MMTTMTMMIAGVSLETTKTYSKFLHQQSQRCVSKTWVHKCWSFFFFLSWAQYTSSKRYIFLQLSQNVCCCSCKDFIMLQLLPNNNRLLWLRFFFSIFWGIHKKDEMMPSQRDQMPNFPVYGHWVDLFHICQVVITLPTVRKQCITIKLCLVQLSCMSKVLSEQMPLFQFGFFFTQLSGSDY